MANMHLSDMKLLHQDSESADKALCGYEKNVFDGFMSKQNVEKMHQYQGANDAEQGSLSYLFAIFN